MPDAQLAQVNVARLRHPVGDPRLGEFFAALAAVNRLADRSPGFVWRHDCRSGHLDGADLLDDDRIVINLSVWDSYRQLHEYVYRTLHGRYVRRRAEWFDRIAGPTVALWWVPAGHRPTPEEACSAGGTCARTDRPTARSPCGAASTAAAAARWSGVRPLADPAPLRHPGPMQPNPLLGVWTLISWQEHDSTGAVIRDPLGAHPRGRLIYTAEGTMAALLAARDRPNFAQRRIERATDAEKSAAAGTFLGYSGAYRYDGQQVVHEVDLCSFPNWVGTNLVRMVELDGDRLTLRTPSERDGRSNVLRWLRG